MHICTYTWIVSYQWDFDKARKNFTKHGVRFTDATIVLEDAFALTISDPSAGDEEPGLLWEKMLWSVCW